MVSRCLRWLLQLTLLATLVHCEGATAESTLDFEGTQPCGERLRQDGQCEADPAEFSPSLGCEERPCWRSTSSQESRCSKCAGAFVQWRETQGFSAERMLAGLLLAPRSAIFIQDLLQACGSTSPFADRSWAWLLARLFAPQLTEMPHIMAWAEDSFWWALGLVHALVGHLLAEAEMLGHQTDAAKAEDKEKAEIKQLFAKIMFKLDQLSNAHFTPRPPMVGAAADAAAKVPSLKMEETIPLMVSDAALRAPEEAKAPRRHAKDQEELSPDEKAAVRRSRKAARKKGLERKVEGGEMSLKDRRDRDQKLQEKNQKVKAEKASKGQVKDKQKRLKASELLAQAAENAKSDTSKKEEVRKQREARPENTPSSKRLKL